MDDLYTPAPNLSPTDIKGEITFVRILIDSMDPKSPEFAEHHAHYSSVLDGLHTQLANFHQPSAVTASSAVSTPGNGSEILSEPSFGSRKRAREPSPPVPNPYSMPARPAPMVPVQAAPTTMPVRLVAVNSNFVDLTRDAVPDIDPFAELSAAFQPGGPRPEDAPVPKWMDDDQFVNFLVQPSDGPLLNTQSVSDPQPVEAGLAYRHSELEEQLSPEYGSNPEALQDLIENIQFDQEVEPEARAKTPAAMSSTLMEHQKIALTWLMKMESSKTKGGILADEMGLGKTVQAIALILANPSPDPACKTTLIVAPVALMKQWKKEIERHVKPHHRLKVHVYHANGRKATFSNLRKFDIVLTTYGTLASELKQKEDRQRQEQNMIRTSRKSARV